MPKRGGAPTAGEQATINRLEEELSVLREKLHKKDVENNRKKQKKKDKKKKRKKESQTSEVFKLCAIICGVVLLVVFCIHDGAYDDFLPSGTISYAYPNQSQGSFVARYLSYSEQEHNNFGAAGKSSVDLSNAYVQASTVVPTYNSVNVATDSNQRVGIGSPTHEYEADYAWVTNTTILLTQQYEDIKWVEQQLGLTDPSMYKDTAEYVKEGSKVKNAVAPLYGGSDSSNVVRAGWGPALCIRNFHERVSDNYKHWGSDFYAYNTTFKKYSESYMDLMLVPEEEYDKYMAGEDCVVTYVNVMGSTQSAKGHCFPWGINQTYIQRPDATPGFKSLVANWNDSGAFTPNTADYPPVQVKWDSNGVIDEASTYLDIVKSVKARTGDYYWMPSLEGDVVGYIGKGSHPESRINSTTGTIIECHGGTMYDKLFGKNGKYRDYYLVGVLVYASEHQSTPSGCKPIETSWSAYNAAGGGSGG